MSAKYYKCVCVCFPLWVGSVWSETFLSCQTSCVENRRETAYVYIIYDVYLCVSVRTRVCV